MSGTTPEAKGGWAGSGWVRPPLFRDDDAEHRQASWLELFFDLVFVVTIAGLAGVLRDHFTYDGLAFFAFLFLPVWWLWMDYSYYGDQFDSDGAWHRVWVLAAMIGVVAISQVSGEVRDGGAAWGPLVFAGMYAILAVGYARAHRANPGLRPLTRRYVVVMVAAGAVYAASAFVPVPYRFWLWGLAVAIPMINSPLSYFQLPDLPSQLSHMPERFGLFAIIALGESVVAVSDAIGHAEMSPPVVAAMLAAFVVAACLWWTFFSRDDPSAMSHALDGDARSHLRSHTYGYAHYFVYVGIVAASLGAEEAILGLAGEAGEHDQPGAVRLGLAGGGALALAGMAVVHAAAAKGLPMASFALRMGAAGTLLAAWAAGLALTPLLYAVAAVLLGVVVAETRILPHPSSLPSEAGQGRRAGAR